MNQCKRLGMAVCFILTLSLCLYVNYTQAAAIDAINPDAGFQFAIVLQGQSTGSISTTASTAFDVLNVALVSVGNSRLTASLDVTSDQTGVWWISLVSLGRTVDTDFAFGFAPMTGGTAQVAVDPTIGFAFATGGVISTTPVTAEEPLLYNINVTGQ
jgi:hypothetical protein